jgi:hypothetical protein
MKGPSGIFDMMRIFEEFDAEAIKTWDFGYVATSIAKSDFSWAIITRMLVSADANSSGFE